ncbi:hypothetical protein BKM25_23090 [Pseudomonas avellanae]|nr:hypothetical protein AO261_28615 [Pseudomonas avellanae]POR73163.1 hypothetical protein BKM25_23090 [Pseudomonas avellanae]
MIQQTRNLHFASGLSGRLLTAIQVQLVNCVDFPTVIDAKRKPKAMRLSLPGTLTLRQVQISFLPALSDVMEQWFFVGLKVIRDLWITVGRFHSLVAFLMMSFCLMHLMTQGLAGNGPLR